MAKVGDIQAIENYQLLPFFETNGLIMSDRDLQLLQNILPFLIPLILIQLGLVIFALIDLIRREKTRGPKWVWVLIILFLNFLGPILYFVVGREDE